MQSATPRLGLMRSGTQWPGEFFWVIDERVLAHVSKFRGRFASVVTDWTLQHKPATKERNSYEQNYIND
jgi:hypothetical protein